VNGAQANQRRNRTLDPGRVNVRFATTFAEKMTVTRIGFLVISALLVCGCGDTVTSRYETRADAEADRLFQRGWLPSIIPQSSYDITTKNDLDINVSEGEFSFSPNHAKEFTDHLWRMDASEVSGADSVLFLERGYWPHAYRDEDSRWTFFVNSEKGHCEYRMGLSRTANSEQGGAGQPATRPESK
jgi:hypothetical protein